MEFFINNDLKEIEFSNKLGLIKYEVEDNSITFNITLKFHAKNVDNYKFIINYLLDNFKYQYVKIYNNSKVLERYLNTTKAILVNDYFYFLNINFIDIDNYYISSFSKTIDYLNSKEFINFDNPEKLYQNYLYLKDTNDLDSYILTKDRKRAKFANILCENKLDIKKYDFISETDYEHRVCYVGFKDDIINNIKDIDIKVEKVDSNNIDMFSAALYLENKKYGEEYSKINAICYQNRILEGKLNYYIIIKDRNIIGYLSAKLYDDILKLEDFYIVKKYRCNGYGSYLFKSVAKLYDAKFLYVLTLDDEPVLSLYKKYGMKLQQEYYFYNILFKKML